ITVDAHPGKFLEVNKLVASPQKASPILIIETTKPIAVISLSGIVENDVTPCHANDNIFRKGYFDSPANRSARSYSTIPLWKPSRRTKPRRKRFTSRYSDNASNARRLSRR